MFWFVCCNLTHTSPVASTTVEANVIEVPSMANVMMSELPTTTLLTTAVPGDADVHEALATA